MKITGKIKNATINFITKKPELTLEINEKNAFEGEFDVFKDKDKLSIEIKQYRKKRSNSANAYAWVLMEEIAKNQGITKDEVYLSQIEKVGVFKPIAINKDAVETITHSWSLHGMGWIVQRIGDSDIDGMVELALYYGSSSYNTQQMTRLINNIIYECQTLGIETKTPDEIANMLSLWKSEVVYGKKHNTGG